MRKGIFFAAALMFFSLAADAAGDGENERLTYPTDYEGQLKEKTVFYFLKVKRADNFFSFNLPGTSFNNLSASRKEKLTEDLLHFYDDVFQGFYDIFGKTPKGYRFNVTFGRTSSNIAFNKAYLWDRTSNVFPNFLPYEDNRNDFSEEEKEILFHEIGHSVFAIMVGNLEHPRTKAIEEGFVDYIALRKIENGKTQKIPVSSLQIENMKGLAQLDVDISIWGEKAVLGMKKHKGYVGVTHHMFGLQFINTFLGVFGKGRLGEFLVRLKASESVPRENDYGTSEVKHIFEKMGYSVEEVSNFELKLHNALKQNIFEIKS